MRYELREDGGEWLGAVGEAEEIWVDCEGEPEEECSSSGSDGRLEDGAGLSSSADWLKPREEVDHLAPLRDVWLRRIEDWGLVSRLRAGFTKGGPGFLTEKEVGHLRDDALRLLQGAGLKAHADVQPGQPFALGLLGGLLALTGDCDQELPQILGEGVPAGVSQAIAPSGVFPAEDRAAKLLTSPFDPAWCDSNWRSAEESPEEAGISACGFRACPLGG